MITTNGTHYFIYFEFTLSTHGIIIQYAIADISVADVASFKTVVGQGYCTNITVVVENQGDFEETFNVTTFYNTTPINITEVTLPSGNSTIITFTWNTTGVAKSNYTISSNVIEVPGETDLSDNVFIDGFVLVTFPGDVNGDGKVRARCHL